MRAETYKQQVDLIRSIGDEIGYGHLMSIAAALWRKDLKENGAPVEGALIPTIELFVKKIHQKDVQDDKHLYDTIVEKCVKDKI